MLLGRVIYLLLLKLVATVPISPTESSDAFIARGRYEPGVHTIKNANPYQGVTVTEGHGKYPVIFEPLQNVQTSRSTYKVTSFINLTPYFISRGKHADIILLATHSLWFASCDQ